MKKVLIVIYDMRIGGAQKSLLSFLQAFSQNKKSSEYQIDVMPFHLTGEFLEQIPEGIGIRQPENVLRWMSTRMSGNLLKRDFSLRGFAGKLIWGMASKLHLLPKTENVQQRLWRVWQWIVPSLKETYDIAISYIDGTANYYVIDKVKASKKILWLHSDYQKQEYDADFDRKFYAACDAAITVSALCRQGLCRAFPEYKDKIIELANISSRKLILDQSVQGECPEYSSNDLLRLLTVGRLHWQKGIDIAVDAAKCLKESGVHFEWLVVGEGAERKRLEQQIAEKGVKDCFRLLGSRSNPYVYIRNCDILVQPSRVEGKSIVLDEAKVLGKPCVVTAYPSAEDAIVHEKTGLLVDIDAQAICGGIRRLVLDEALKNQIIDNVSSCLLDAEKELERYIDIML